MNCWHILQLIRDFSAEPAFHPCVGTVDEFGLFFFSYPTIKPVENNVISDSHGCMQNGHYILLFALF